MNYTEKQIAQAIDLEALAWAKFFKVNDTAEIEARRNVMRANVAVGYIKPLVEFLSKPVNSYQDLRLTNAQAEHLAAILDGRTGNLNVRVLAALQRRGFILPYSRKSQIPVTIDGENALADWSASFVVGVRS